MTRTRAIIAAAVLFTLPWAIAAALPGPMRPPKEKPLPIETVRGYVKGTFTVWGQWGNQTKTFNLLDSVIAPSKSGHLAYPSREVYLEIERLDGQFVEAKVVRADREGDTWLVVLSLEALP